MKKSIFALAAAGLFVGAAHAQTSVTMYGVIDTNVEYVNKLGTTGGTSGSVVRMNSGGFASNRWGIRGVEDIGGGLSGVFAIGGGFNTDTGTQLNSARLFDLWTFVGLNSNKYGQLTFGRQYGAFFRGLANYSPSAFAPQYEPIAFMTGLDLRSDNSVNYSGQFGAFTARANWTFGNGVFGSGETPGQFRANSGHGVAFDYSPNNFGIAVAYDQYNPTYTPLGDLGIGKSRKAAIAAKYSFGAFLLSGGYRWEKNDFSNGSTALHDDFFWAGVNYQVTPVVNLMLAYYYDKPNSVKAEFNGTEIDRPNPYQISFMASFNFSKRTNVYLTTAYSKNASLAFGGVSTTSAGNTYLLAPGKNSQFGAAIGIRHIF